MDSVASLSAEIEAEARREPFDLCLETYERAGRDPRVPILCGGSTQADWCAVGRELGRDEVLAGEPLIGMSGRRFRRAFHETVIGPAPKTEKRFEAVLEHVLLTNLVPYRPVKNKAYDRPTRARFRPFIERLLADVWTGSDVLALGEHAVRWFAPYAPPDAIADLWADRERRFHVTLPIEIRGRALRLHPVPHPSPLSPFRSQFAQLLAAAVART